MLYGAVGRYIRSAEAEHTAPDVNAIRPLGQGSVDSMEQCW